MLSHTLDPLFSISRYCLLEACLLFTPEPTLSFVRNAVTVTHCDHLVLSPTTVWVDSSCRSFLKVHKFSREQILNLCLCVSDESG